MARKKTLFVINPISGTHSKANIPTWIETTLDKDLFEPEIVFTQYGGHASELARQAVEKGYDMVVSVGGDGTCNEIAGSLVQTDVALGIIPVGSGNGLARHLGIPLNPLRALQIFNDAIVDNIDYCMANDDNFELKFEISQLLNFLTDKQKQVIFYRYYCNYSDNEISEIMGISRQAVNKIKNRALNVLRILYSN